MDRSISVRAVIFLQNHIKLIKLTDEFNIDEQELIFVDLYNEYEDIRKEFKINYHYTFKWSINFQLAILVLYLWKNVYYTIHEGEWVCGIFLTADITQLILFLVTASLMTESFYKLKLALFEYGSQLMDKDNSKNRQDYQYLLSHLQEKPMEIKVGSFTVTKGNAIAFAVGFVVAKFFAYIVQYLYPDL